MKLHLGCGENYLKDYVNIDFPAEKHTIQKKIVADRLINIKNLKYPADSINEIRMHHVFEHFPRAIACALLVTWYSWLKENGTLRIEVPDLEKMAQRIVSRFSSEKNKLVAERHIFGSQEASWAVHYTGYSPDDLSCFLERYGFKINKIKKNNWKGTANIEIYAVKNNIKITPQEFEKITRKYLSMFLVDKSISEKGLFEVWMNSYHDQIRRGTK